MPPTPIPEGVGPFGGDSIVKTTEDSLDALFAAESDATFRQAWQKLDRGARLDRLRKFVQTFQPADGTTLSPAERASLLTAILQAFELRQLNSKAMVEYEPASARVILIRGLRERVNPVTGLRYYRIDTAAATPASRATQKQKTPKVTAAATNLNGATTTDSAGQ